MIFDKFFRRDNVADEQARERQQQTNSMVMGQPDAQLDEKNLMEKRQILVELTQWQQDRQPAMQKLFEKLSGYYYDLKSKTLMKSTWDTGYTTLIGASKLVNYIEPLDHNVMLANWSDKVLIVTMRDAIAHPLRRYIRDNHNEIGVSIDHAEYVFWIIVNTVEPTYWRGWNNGERRMNQEMIKINEVRSVAEKEKKKQLFGLGG
jgi:hypothetical protein